MLNQVIKRKQLEKLKAEMDALRTTRAGLDERRAALVTREQELEQAIGEVTAETSAEDQALLDEATGEWSAQDAALTAEENENDEATQRIQAQIDDIQRELDEMESRSLKASKAAKTTEKREGKKAMNTRKFFGMNPQERDAFFANGEVKDFLTRVRAMKGEKRAITGAELLIPTVVLDVLRENVIHYSKLYRHVGVRNVPGKARQTVMGVIPEAVWTEMCATLNEMNLSFAGVETDGYKVGGYFAVCNALLEDADDVDLAAEIISALGQSIGKALDKAILYGTGTKMPLGIVTRLVQASDPSDKATTLPWVKLDESNVIAITGKTDVALYKELILATGAAKGDYSRGEKFWAMNEKTYTKLIANSLSITAAGAIVAGQQGEMPVVGGAIEVLSFVPDDVIVGGYGDLYLLAERAGTTVNVSEHAKFIEDQTVFKGTARYDGRPVIAEGFVAIGIGGEKPTASGVTFASDTAN